MQTSELSVAPMDEGVDLPGKKKEDEKEKKKKEEEKGSRTKRKRKRGNRRILPSNSWMTTVRR
jgi:carbamate kinase